VVLLLLVVVAAAEITYSTPKKNSSLSKFL